MIGKQIQHYRIISELGEGGMGKVYKAFDTKLERYVAIKFLSPHLLNDKIFLDRFKTEGKNHAKLSHPNIVLVYGFIEYNDLVGLIIEFVEGITIENLIQKYKRLNLIYSLKIIRQVLIALEYAHSKGLIHRDIKPSNIIIDKNGIAKLMDFGISKSIHSKTDLTRMGRNVGTILYMSPEQISNQESTAKTDLYSLAITLYEMISGAPPYLYDIEFKIYEAHLNQVPERLSSKYSDVPPEVDELILSAMNKSSKTNFSSTIEFRKAVEDLIFSLPVKINQLSSLSQNNTEKPKVINRTVFIPLFFLITLF
jgi:serine/threonine-protein kinase